MIIASAIDLKYNNIKPFLNVLEKRVKETISNYANNKGFTHSIRIKTRESLSEKIESGRYKKWSDIDDLVAGTIVIPNISFEKEVLEFLTQSFKKYDVKERGKTQLSPESFRFDSTRFIGIEKVELAEDIDLLFEVQIHTAFEHAWSFTTHSLTYKSNEIDWKKLRLVAQIKAVVEQLDMLILGFDNTSKHISPHDWTEVNVKIEIINSFKKLISDKLLPDDFIPKDWSRFSDNYLTIIKSVKNYKRSKIKEFVNNSLEIINSKVLDLQYPSPLSVSLLQFCFCVLYERKYLDDDFEGYLPIITEEMETFFPVVKHCETRFSFD